MRFLKARNKKFAGLLFLEKLFVWFLKKQTLIFQTFVLTKDKDKAMFMYRTIKYFFKISANLSEKEGECFCLIALGI